ncbi:chaperone heat shock protein Hsp12 [Pyrenophora tritici-repentis]|nr:heat shock protein awh11 [Pyrenophora tritici-repentis]KAF7449368.1 heat shock protein awh11 [Pyrenophora tritici-repentis]KAF7570611.1 chaperone/heat shock protein Hsp12 [Pyrenophora tritici-repentis]KAG9383613.1 heat shock protein awh11 [Pyrenophora tritici-repentis]KAI1534659.1 chaperone heat shock protein Hsp12 [Pyrenophora tritici-repentis]
MRKGLGEQAQEKITPDSQKSTMDKASESLTGAGDRVAGAVQPEGQKSAGQKVGDATRSGGDNASSEGKGMMESAQETVGNAAQSVQDTLSGKK